MSSPTTVPAAHNLPNLPKKRPEVLARATYQLRERLLDDVEALVAHRHLDAEHTAGLRPRFGYQSQVEDVLRLVSIYRAHWAAVERVTRLKVGDLEHAESLAYELAGAFAGSLWSRRTRHGRPESDVRPKEPTAPTVEIGDCVISMEIGPANTPPETAPDAATPVEAVALAA